MKSKSLKPSVSQIYGWFTKAAVITIITTIAIVVISNFMVARVLTPFKNNAIRMEVAAAQAGRVQKIGVLATQLQNAKRAGKLYSYRSALASELDSFVAHHRALLFGDPALGLSDNMSANARELTFNGVTGLDRAAREFEAEVRANFLNDSLSVKGELAQELQKNTQNLLTPKLNQLIALYGEEARADLQSIRAVQLTFLAVLFLVLLLIQRLCYKSLADRAIVAIYGLDGEGSEPSVRYDDVTGKANRLFLISFLGDLCKLSQKHDFKFATAHIEVMLAKDEISELEKGLQNEIICRASWAIESTCRSGDFISRVGPSEFVVVLTSLEDDDTLGNMINSIHEKLAEPIAFDKQVFDLKSKIGIKLSDKRDKTPTSILNQVNLALKTAKASPSSDLKFFASNDAPLSDQRDLDFRELKSAISEAQLCAYFQPIVQAENDVATGLEALARWEHPKRGLLTPLHFIDTLRERDLSNELTRVILGNCLTSMRSWRENLIEIPYISITLELSQIRDTEFVEEIIWIIDSYGENPSKIAIELSASTFAEAKTDENVAKNIQRLTAHNMRAFLDDFRMLGTDLSLAAKLGFEQVKIDRTIIQNIDSLPHAQSTASILTAAAHKAGLEVVAEGVETPAARAIVTKAKANKIQGFLISEPLSKEAIGAWLEDNSRKVAQEAASA